MKIIMVGPPNLGPYHHARFREVVKLCPDFAYVRIKMEEVYRPWSVDAGPFPCRLTNVREEGGMRRILEREKPDSVIVIGYNHLDLIRAARWAKGLNVPSIIQAVSTVEDHPRIWWKETLKKFIVRTCFDAALNNGGERTTDYLKSLGMREDKIWRVGNTVDNRHFDVERDKWAPPKGFPEEYFLTVCRLSPEKNLARLLHAFNLYRVKGGRWGLVIAGTGPAEASLKEAAPKELKGCIHWYGWACYKDLPSLYRGASCFVLSSMSEPWGLVVNEAMAAGLPVLVSRNCGCVPELCHAGVNGYDFDPYDVEEIAQLMLRISSGEADLAAMSKASKEIISAFTPAIYASTLVGMCETLVSSRCITRIHE